MFYNGREVLSDHFQLILFWIPESSFCKKKNGIKWEERKEVPDLGKIPTFSRFVFGRLPLMNWHCIYGPKILSLPKLICPPNPNP